MASSWFLFFSSENCLDGDLPFMKINVDNEENRKLVIYIYIYTGCLYIQGVSGGIVNVLGSGSFNYSE